MDLSGSWNMCAHAGHCGGSYQGSGIPGYGASFDRQTESHIPAAGLEVDESRYVVDDLVKLICVRAARRSN